MMDLNLDGLTRGLLDGLAAGDRASLARSITLVESTHPVKASQARRLVTHATRHSRDKGVTQATFRLGLSGPPGAGKSTFIEALGLSLVDKGHKAGFFLQHNFLIQYVVKRLPLSLTTY